MPPEEVAEMWLDASEALMTEHEDGTIEVVADEDAAWLLIKAFDASTGLDFEELEDAEHEVEAMIERFDQSLQQGFPDDWNARLAPVAGFLSAWEKHINS